MWQFRFIVAAFSAVIALNLSYAHAEPAREEPNCREINQFFYQSRYLNEEVWHENFGIRLPEVDEKFLNRLKNLAAQCPENGFPSIPRSPGALDEILEPVKQYIKFKNRENSLKEQNFLEWGSVFAPYYLDNYSNQVYAVGDVSGLWNLTLNIFVLNEFRYERWMPFIQWIALVIGQNEQRNLKVNVEQDEDRNVIYFRFIDEKNIPVTLIFRIEANQVYLHGIDMLGRYDSNRQFEYEIFVYSLAGAFEDP